MSSFLSSIHSVNHRLITNRPLRKKGKQPARRDSSRRNQDRKSRQEPKKTRPAKKTAEELDAEMADYWTEAGGNNAPASTIQPSATQTAPAAPDTDVGMNELVSWSLVQ